MLISNYELSRLEHGVHELFIGGSRAFKQVAPVETTGGLPQLYTVPNQAAGYLVLLAILTPQIKVCDFNQHLIQAKGSFGGRVVISRQCPLVRGSLQPVPC